MKIRFFDQKVDVKQCTIGSVVFEIVLTDKHNRELYRPVHIVGFSHNYCGELILVVKGSKSTRNDEYHVHPGNLSWDCRKQND